MLPDVVVELHRPRDAALEKSETELREPSRHPAEKERLAEGLAGHREVADMVVHVARGRAPRAPAHTVRMTGRRDLELHAFFPERVVIIQAVHGKRIDPG